MDLARDTTSTKPDSDALGSGNLQFRGKLRFPPFEILKFVHQLLVDEIWTKLYVWESHAETTQWSNDMWIVNSWFLPEVDQALRDSST